MSLIAKFQRGPLDGELRAVPEDMPTIIAAEYGKPQILTDGGTTYPLTLAIDQMVYRRTVRLEGETAIIMGFDVVYQDARTLNHFSL